MYRYFVLIWNQRDSRATASARSIAERILSMPTGWTQAYEAEGVAAFHSGLGEGASGTCTLHHGAGAVFGRIFNRDIEDTTAALRVDFDRAESLKIVQTGGRRLIQRYWGRYVALVQDAATSETWVLRDPSGAMPCLMANHQGVNLVFSDLADCEQLGLMHFTVSWQYIRGMLGHPGLHTRDTALKEVSLVQLGERIRFSGSSVHRSLEWNPFTIARTDPIEDPQLAITELRRTTRAVVHAWAACYPGVVHNLSGGLDSSIVLSCLKDAPSQPDITCIHYFGTGPDEDERRYARLMAGHVKLELIEHRLDVGEARLSDLFKMRKSDRPWYYMYELEHGQFEGQLALQRKAGALFSGAGGDGVFFQAHAELAVTDYMFDHGLGRDLLRVAVDAARVSRKSIWPLLFKAVRTGILRPRWNAQTAGGSFKRTLVNQDVLRAGRNDESLTHPWFSRSLIRGVPPGILWHALTVATPPAYYNAFAPGAYPERTLPLLSQPLVELCLRIPTYVLIKSGMDRAMARRAFAADLPPEIVKRRNKGRIDQHIRNILDANLDFVREFLLDGRLVKEGLLDRRNLELYLSRDRSPADFQYTEILQQHVCIEAWLSGWLDDRAPARDCDPAGLSLSHQALRI